MHAQLGLGQVSAMASPNARYSNPQDNHSPPEPHDDVFFRPLKQSYHRLPLQMAEHRRQEFRLYSVRPSVRRSGRHRDR